MGRFQAPRVVAAALCALVLPAAARQAEPRRDPAARAGVVADPGAEALERPIFGRNRLDELTSVADLVIASPKVASELKVTPEQRRAIADAVQASSPNMTGLRNRLRDANTWVARGTAGHDVLDRAWEAIRTAESGRTAAVRAHLSRSQYRRLLQIAIQQKGYRALAMPDVAAEVGLAPEQEASIRGILDDREPERAALIDRIQQRIRPAEQERYERILAKERARGRLSDDEQAFMNRWFEAKADQARQVDRFEDRIDARIFNVLNRTQKERFRRLVGDLVETEGPPPQVAPGSVPKNSTRPAGGPVQPGTPPGGSNPSELPGGASRDSDRAGRSELQD